MAGIEIDRLKDEVLKSKGNGGALRLKLQASESECRLVDATALLAR